MKTSKKIMFNEDLAHHFGEYAEAGQIPTPQNQEKYIEQFRGSQVTDSVININYLLSLYPSKTIMSYPEKYYQKEENGQRVDYTQNLYHKVFIENNYDIIAHWIELLRKINIRPWLSFRMNDCHDSTAEASFMLDDYYHKNTQLRRVTHHAPTEYFDRCYDYGKQEIRDRMFNYINESLERYDVDGVELDFLREQFCFSIGGEYAGQKIMLDFVRRVRSLLDDYGKKRNKRLELSIRIPQNAEDAFYEGFDVITMAQEKLLDVIVVCARWCPTDNDLPMEFWKKILAPYDVELGAGLELIVQSCSGGELFWLQTHQTALASAYQNLCAGADFTYIFNFMRTQATNFEDESNQVMFQDLYKWENYQLVLHNAGQKETAQKQLRRHIPTFHDTVPAWRERFRPLPAVCNDANKYTQLRIRTGEVLKTDRVLLILGCSYNPEGTYKSSLDMREKYAMAEKFDQDNTPLPLDNFQVFINSHRMNCIGTEDVRPFFTRKKGYVFELDDNSVMQQVNMVEIAVENGKLPFNTDYAEIRIIPQNRE